MRDTYVDSVRKGATPHCKVRFERLRAMSEPCCQQHSTTTKLITQAVRDWCQKLAKLFSWSVEFAQLRE